MSGEIIRNVVIDKDSAPEVIAEIDRAEIRRGEGLVLITGETEKKVSHVGEFAVDLMVEAGFASEESIAEISPVAQAIIDQLSERNSLLQIQVESLEEEKSSLEAQLGSMRTDIAGLQGELNDLREKLAGGKTLDEQLKEAFGDEWVPRNKIPVKVMREGKTVSGWTAISEPFQNEEGQWNIRVTDGEEIEELPLNDVSENDTAPPITAERTRYVPRESVSRRLRNRTPWGVEERDYYVDDRGIYYLENDEPFYVEREVVEGRDVGAVALAGAVVVGIAAWELVGERIFGFGDGSSHALKQVINNQTVEITNLHKVNEHLTDVNQHLTGVDQHLTNVDHHLSGEIGGLHHQIAHDHREEMGAIHRLQLHELKERMTSHPLYFGFRYPWDWAASKVGQVRANGLLYTLSGRAAEHGHHVQWLGSGQHRMLKIDGTFNTKHVVGVLTRYLGH
jgi:hypothetical protein